MKIIFGREDNGASFCRGRSVTMITHGQSRRNQSSLHSSNRGRLSRTRSAARKSEPGHRVSTVFTGTVNATKRRVDGETYDMIIMSSSSIDQQIKAGRAAAGSRVDLAKSGVALGVPKGAPKPDIGSVDKLKQTILAAKSIGYSTGPSGVYMTGLFDKLGVSEQIQGKLRQTPSGVFVGDLIRQA